jgi:hypothetical protein
MRSTRSGNDRVKGQLVSFRDRPAHVALAVAGATSLACSQEIDFAEKSGDSSALVALTSGSSDGAPAAAPACWIEPAKIEARANVPTTLRFTVPAGARDLLLTDSVTLRPEILAQDSEGHVYKTMTFSRATHLELRFLSSTSVAGICTAEAEIVASAPRTTVDSSENVPGIAAPAEETEETGTGAELETEIESEIETGTGTGTGTPRRLELTMTVAEQTTTVASDDVDLVFLIDDSASMGNKITRLKNSLGSFIQTLTQGSQGGDRFNVSVVTLSDYLRTMPEHSVIPTMGGYVPTNLRFHGYVDRISRNYNFTESSLDWASPWRGISYDYTHRIVEDVTVAKVPQVRAAIEGITLTTNEKEPLIAAAMEYVNYRTFTDAPAATAPKLTAGQMVHIVALTDENSDRIVDYGPSYESYAYTNDHYYFSAELEYPGACAVPDQTLPGETGRYYELESGHVCKKGDDLIPLNRIFRSPSIEETWRCTSPGFALATSAYANPTYPWSDWSTAKACETYQSYSCTRTADGAPITETTSLYGATRARYSSCTPVGAKAVSLMSGTEAEWAQHYWSSMGSCHAITCEKVAYSVRYDTTVTNEAITGITERACDPGFTKVDGTAVFGKMAMNLDARGDGTWRRPDFCPKVLPPATRAALPATLSVKTVLRPGSRQTQDFYVAMGAAGTKEELIDRVEALENVVPGSLVFKHEPTGERRAYADTAEGAADLFARVHGDKHVYFHSIVSQDGVACAGDDGAGNVARGSEYIALSEKTGGSVGDICSPTFDGFLDDLARVASSQIVQDYDLRTLAPEGESASAVAGARIVSVRNLRTGATLPVTSFAYVDGMLHIARGAVVAGDSLKVTIEPN